jgi:hypothetical protein
MMIALAAVLVVAALFFTLRIKPSQLPPVESESPLQPLEEAKARIYENLRDLQFEYRLDKITDEDYQSSKQELQKELARVLSQMDALGGKTAKPASQSKAKPENTCPHCGASFKDKLKFCGECGKAMA